MDDDENVLWYCCGCGAGGVGAMRVNGHLSCLVCDHHRCDYCRTEYGNPRGERPKQSKSRKKVNNQYTGPSIYFTVETPTTPNPDSLGPFVTPSPRNTGIGSVHIDSSSLCPDDSVRGKSSPLCARLGNSSTSVPPRSKMDLPISSNTCRRSVSPQKTPQPKEKRAKKRKQSTLEPERKNSEKFACPFYKRYPLKFCSRDLKYRACSGPGWPQIRHLKDHLENSHKGEDDDINVAAQWNEIEELLKTKSKRKKSESQVWSEWWKTLFPTDIEPKTPYYDFVESIPQVTRLDLDDLLGRFETILQIHYKQAGLEPDKMTTASECAVHACRDMLNIARNDQVNKSGVKASQTNMPEPKTAESSTDTRDIEAAKIYYPEPSLTICKDPKPCQEYVVTSIPEFQWGPYPAPEFGHQYPTVASVSREYFSANTEVNPLSESLPTSSSLYYGFPYVKMPYNSSFQLDNTQTQNQRINEQALTSENVFVPLGASSTETQIHSFEYYDPLAQGTEVSSGTLYDGFGYNLPAIIPSTGFEVRNLPFTENDVWNENHDHNFLDGS